MSDETFLYRELPSVRKKVFRMGLAVNYGIDEGAVREALFERNVNFVYYTFRSGALCEPLREALVKDRERYVVSAVPLLGFYAGGVRRGVENTLKDLRTDYLDVLLLGWLGVTSALTGSVLEELLQLRESGKVRAIGCSIHDRERAGRLAADSPLDVFMLRYNAAHPGAEREVFPHLAKRHPSVVAYTATSWRQLLKAPRGWTDKVPTAGDCYRFCLTNPHVDLVLTGPASREELAQNLAALERGPLNSEEEQWMRTFGRAVHG